MISFLLRAGTLLVIAILFFVLYGAVCDYLFTTEGYENKTAKREWIFMQKGKRYDYAILGSSRAESGLNINLIDSITKKKGINIGVGGAGFADNYLVLNKFIDANKVNTVYLQIDIYSFDYEKGFSNSFNIPNFLPYWDEVPVKQVLMDYVPNKDATIWSVAPFLRYIKYNKYYSPFELVRRVAKVSAYQSDKFDISSGTKAPEAKTFNLNVFNAVYKDSLEYEVQEKDKKYFYKIIELCKAKNVKLVVFRSPEFWKIKDKQINRKKVMDQIYTMMEENNLIVLDKSEAIEIDYRNFVDATHLSDQGVDLFSKNFITFISK